VVGGQGHCGLVASAVDPRGSKPSNTRVVDLATHNYASEGVGLKGSDVREEAISSCLQKCPLRGRGMNLRRTWRRTMVSVISISTTDGKSLKHSPGAISWTISQGYAAQRVVQKMGYQGHHDHYNSEAGRE